MALAAAATCRTDSLSSRAQAWKTVGVYCVNARRQCVQCMPVTRARPVQVLQAAAEGMQAGDLAWAHPHALKRHLQAVSHIHLPGH